MLAFAGFDYSQKIPTFKVKRGRNPSHGFGSSFMLFKTKQILSEMLFFLRAPFWIRTPSPALGLKLCAASRTRGFTQRGLLPCLVRLTVCSSVRSSSICSGSRLRSWAWKPRVAHVPLSRASPVGSLSCTDRVHSREDGLRLLLGRARVVPCCSVGV